MLPLTRGSPVFVILKDFDAPNIPRIYVFYKYVPTFVGIKICIQAIYRLTYRSLYSDRINILVNKIDV